MVPDSISRSAPNGRLLTFVRNGHHRQKSAFIGRVAHRPPTGLTSMPQPSFHITVIASIKLPKQPQGISSLQALYANIRALELVRHEHGSGPAR
jgi:hypothetical protein